MTLVPCAWCAAAWPADDPIGLKRHEARCAERVRCPRCGAGVSERCAYPGGQTVTGGHHAARETAAAER